MFLQGRPLLATAADARFFVDRDEQLKQLERSVRSGFNTVIYGDKGSGKSTLLHHIEYRERQSRPVAYVNAAGSDGVRDLIESVRQAIVMHTPGTPALTATDLSPGPVMISFDRLPPGVASAVLATELRRIGELTPTVVLVDASTAADTSYELFGRMRDQLWEMDHRWIVAVDTTDRPTLARPPADAFFDISIQLPVLGTGQVAELLRLRGSGLSESELVQIAGASEGNPRRALELARQ